MRCEFLKKNIYILCFPGNKVSCRFVQYANYHTGEAI